MLDRTDLTIRIGRDDVRVPLPPGHRVTYISKRPIPVLDDPPRALEEALSRPTGSEPLEALAVAARSAVVVIPDLTRPCPDKLLLPAVLARLARGGLGPDRVRVVIATGLHRALSEDEMFQHLDAIRRMGYDCINHQASTVSGLVDLGTFTNDLPVTVSSLVASADLIVSTGIVEPHQFAGFSGGYKTIVIGTGGEATINASHSPRFLARPGVGLGVTSGNPFHEFLREAGRRARHRFAVNVVLDPGSRIAAIAAGEPGEVQAQLVPIASRAYLQPVEGDFDIAIAGVPHPKDQNVYQASRVATYLQGGHTRLIRDGGTVVVGAACPEGAGRGTGEVRFARAMEELGDPAAFITTAERDGLDGGGQRAYFVARVLAHNGILFVGAHDPALIERMGMATAPDLEAAIARLLPPGPPKDVLVVEDPFRTLPVREA